MLGSKASTMVFQIYIVLTNFHINPTSTIMNLYKKCHILFYLLFSIKWNPVKNPGFITVLPGPELGKMDGFSRSRGSCLSIQIGYSHYLWAWASLFLSSLSFWSTCRFMCQKATDSIYKDWPIVVKLCPLITNF